MKKQHLSICLLLISVFLYSCGEESMDQLIEKKLEQSVRQYKHMAQSLIDQPEKLPRTTDSQQHLVTSGSDWWCSGFFPGSLWYLYENSKDQELLGLARTYTDRLEKEKYNRSTHDLGFMLYCSYGNGYRLTENKAYKDIMLTGAESLATRYNPLIGCIQSWGSDPDNWQFPVIIDNMMNLEFLFWASRVSGNPYYRDICISHADKTIENHFRPDFSSYHVVSYDTITGSVEKKKTAQGYGDETSWSRGQSWGLYGYVVMYRETKDPKYLDQANRIANYLISHPRMPENMIPYWDYDAPNIPDALRDASAASIMASALLELMNYVDKGTAEKYRQVAEKQIRTLSSSAYFAEEGTNGNFILKHSVGDLTENSEVDVPLTYADYYYIEALLRYKSFLAKK